MTKFLLDTNDRPLMVLRISVTDRCNFRCQYCMPKDIFGKDYQFLPHNELLTFEEILRFVNSIMPYGVGKVRITGGEPLARKNVEELIGMLHEAHPALELAMTTNGSLLPQKAKKLKENGLDRVTVSLDALDDETFMAMNDVSFPVKRVLDGIRAAEEYDLHPIKINMVVKRGVNGQSILPMAEYFRERGHTLRFIEYMDVGSTNGWKMDDVVPASEILDTIRKVHPLEPVNPDLPSDVAKRWKYVDGKGEIGLIASVTDPFCGDCTRLRLSAPGELFTCLFAKEGHDIKSLIRGSVSDEELADFVSSLWHQRDDNYSEMRAKEGSSDSERVEMSYIGG
jgi:cyclic pyranopterin phosphate synthase